MGREFLLVGLVARSIAHERIEGALLVRVAKRDLGRIMGTQTIFVVEGKMMPHAGVFRMCLITASSSSGNAWPLRNSFSWRTSRPYDTRVTFSVMGYIIVSKSWSSSSFQSQNGW